PAPAANAPATGAVPDTAPATSAGVAADARSSASSPAVPVPAPIVAPPAASCSASPTVQFQGRGLAATGIAPVAPGEQAGSVNVTVQQSAADAASALGAVQTRIAAVRDALTKAGVPAAAVQVSYYRSYGDTASRQFTAYASLQASVTGADAMAEATKAVLQVPGVTAYSTSSPGAGRPSQEQVQTAVGQAAAQARDMANSTATAAGVR